MKPFPALHPSDRKTTSELIPALPDSSNSPAWSFSSANRRASTCTAQRFYPWLLSASTATAALFCLMYVTKPVIMTDSPAIQTPKKIATAMSGGADHPASLIPSDAVHPSSLMPSDDLLPGDQNSSAKPINPIAANPRSALPGPPSANAFEETNLRIQHILTAEAPGGHIDRIDIDVPVLYHSRNLRWTQQEISTARDLLARLMDYQEKSRQLRAEGAGLLDTWNHLIATSIPASELRADSPSLPENQKDTADSPRPPGFSTTESIQIQTSGK